MNSNFKTNYNLIYSSRKTVGISIKNGEITVRAPRGMKIEAVNSILSKHLAWIIKALKKDAERKNVSDRLTDEEIKRLRSHAKEYFQVKCRYYAELMNAEYTRITITGAKNRFGSCSSKKSLSFSYLLMLYPEQAREYVVVHELAHLFYMNHSKSFYQLVERYMPDYKERKRLLKQPVQSEKA